MQKKIGPYELIRSIAKGGMGEVFLAYDPHCKREIALKCIRSEYLENETIYKRFIKEAHIASQLTHPNIIPIYTISKQDTLPYYTMPYINGNNLKEILVEALQQERDPQNIGTPRGSIHTLTRIFLTICEAVSYAHEMQIIHRDLKPENILIGQYGEVLIFDWGVADKIQNITQEDPQYAMDELEFPNLTSPGKIIGTLSFLAPERFNGAPANYQTDIYSLGVMLYMILTLKLPFHRKKLKEIKKNLHREVLKNPIEVAPYRDIPHPLVNITQKCLAADPKERYLSMQELLEDLKNFVRGSSEWVEKAPLDFYNKDHWVFHENLLISRHQAISRRVDAFEWICMMISKPIYNIHTRLDLQVTLKEGCLGIGFIINADKVVDRATPYGGYDVWLSANPSKPSKLSRHSVELLSLPHVFLEPNKTYKIQFEQLDNRILLYINGVRQFSYLSYFALLGKQVGLIYRDTLFTLQPLRVFVSSPSLVVSCLEVPKVFVADKNYDKALIEYRRIGHAFPGRHESREAFFRGGLCLIEKAEAQKETRLKNQLLDQALIEFENLKGTPGAPLEYLGKALVYRAQKEVGEELKCLELAIRRYPQHPLLYLIYDHIIYRMYQSSHHERKASYEFILLALRYNSYAQRKQMIDPFILQLADKKGVYFFLSKCLNSSEMDQTHQMIINLGFLLSKSYVLSELLPICKNPILFRNALTALWLLGEKEVCQEHQSSLEAKDLNLFQLLQKKTSKPLFESFFQLVRKGLTDFAEKILFILLDRALFLNQIPLIDFALKQLEDLHLEVQQSESLEKIKLEKNLITHRFDLVAKSLQLQRKKAPQIHFEKLFLEGCYLYGTQNLSQALSYFEQELDSPLVDFGNLACLYLTKRLQIKQWGKTAFDFEYMTLYRQLYLFYQSGKNSKKAQEYYEKWKRYSYYS